MRACSSLGRACAWHAQGTGFDPPQVHSIRPSITQGSLLASHLGETSVPSKVEGLNCVESGQKGIPDIEISQGASDKNAELRNTAD